MEDQTILRESLAAMLAGRPEVEVVGESADAERAIEEIGALAVDVVLMDVQLPGMNGIEATRLLKDRHPDLAVLILTFLGDEYVGAAIDAGAAGYLLKTCTGEELLAAVRAARAGRTPVDPSLVTRLVKELTELRSARRETLLTARQTDVLRLIAAGERHRQVASALFISESTVSREVHSNFDRLGVNDAAHAVAEAYKMGLL